MICALQKPGSGTIVWLLGATNSPGDSFTPELEKSCRSLEVLGP